MVLTVYAGIPFALWCAFRISRTYFMLLCTATNQASFSGCCASIILFCVIGAGRAKSERTPVELKMQVLSHILSTVSTTMGGDKSGSWFLLRHKRRRDAGRAVVVCTPFFQSNGKLFSPARYCSPWFPARAPAQQHKWNKPWLKLTSRQVSKSGERLCFQTWGAERVCKSSIWVNVVATCHNSVLTE